MNVLIIDAASFLWRAFHALPLACNEDGVSIHALEFFARYILKRVRVQGWATHALVVFDGSGENFRHVLYPAYKAHRPPMDPSLREQILIAPMLCAAYGMASVVSEGVEADDVIATVARQSARAGAKVIVASPDKDILQLVDDRISVYDQKSGRMFSTPDSVREHLGVYPHQVVDWLALAGDSADGFSGVPGVGPKTAAAWLRLGESLDGLIERPGVIGQARLQKKFIQHQDDVRLYRTLATLKDDVPDMPTGDGLLVDMDAAPIRFLRRMGISSLANITQDRSMPMDDIPPCDDW